MAIAPPSHEELLRSVPILRELSEADLRRLAEVADLRKTARGSALFTAGQRAEGLFILRTGEIKVVKGGLGGREQILYLARPSRVIVEGMRFDGGAYPVDAVAMRAATALLITNEAIDELGEKRPHLLRAMLNVRAHRFDRMIELIGDLALRTVLARLASFLTSLSATRESRGEDPRIVVRDLTTETVASRLGTVREEISRGLAELERRGALRVSTDIIEILDLELLRQVAALPKRTDSPVGPRGASE